MVACPDSGLCEENHAQFGIAKLAPYDHSRHREHLALRARGASRAHRHGYRWGPSDVTHLLDDIWTSGGKSYGSAADWIVVKLHCDAEKPDNQQWELIDGHQRLTTLYLIFRYTKKDAKQGFSVPYSIFYQTRPGSQERPETREVQLEIIL
ncbi:DUF262 domain-containing protein [Paraburkholderia dipogonis]|uniref:DUF262 domain-containing protein n=1 Tax=Paraburkholderia dipogonis TaxID=1211383 RepID=UPI0031343C95